MLYGSTAFTYWEGSSNEWSARLKGWKEAALGSVTIPVLWGAHEAWRGSRDFSRASRLKLERLLTEVSRQGLTATVTLGLPGVRLALPEWAASLDERAWVPEAIWEGRGYGSVLIPSLRSPTLHSAFIDFVREAVSLLSLYIAPDGPIEAVVVDLSLYESDQGEKESLPLFDKLRERYETLAELNASYGTTFFAFEALSSSRGARTLFEKRPWLAAHDYAWCRARWLESVFEQVKRLCTEAGIRCPVVRSHPFPLRSSNASAPWHLVIDPTFLVPTPVGFTPYSVMGQILESTLPYFRLHEYLRERALQQGICVEYLPQLSPPVEQTKLLVVLCGKYLAQAAFQKLSEASLSAALFFPFGTPQYDEQMRTLVFAGAKAPIPFTLGEHRLLRLAGKNIFFANVGYDESAWDRLTDLASLWLGHSP